MPFRFDFKTAASRDDVFRAFTDFTEQRLVIWKRTLTAEKYEVRELADDHAVVKEGSGGTKIWVLLRYEWTAPDSVRWTLLDSDHCDSGSGDVRIARLPDGGSRVDVVIDHGDPRGARGRLILFVQRLLGPVVFPRMWKSALDKLAAGGTWP